MSPTILNNIFAPNTTPYNLCNLISFKMCKVLLGYNGTESLFYLGPKLGA